MQLLRSVVVCAFATLLASCCTMGLWGFEQEDGDDDEDGAYVAVEGTRWEWWRVLLRIAATPVTLVADAGIGMVEGSLSVFGDDDDDCERSSRSHSSLQIAKSKSRSSRGGASLESGTVRSVR